MKTITLLACFAVFLIVNSAFAQSVQNTTKQSKKPNFYEIRNQFYETLKSQPAYQHIPKEAEDDDLEAKFKRWEYLMWPRTFPTGDIPDPTVLMKEWEAYRDLHPEIGTLRTANWSPIGTSVVPSGGGGAGRLNVVEFDPTNSNVIYVGSAGGGVWKSTNGGTTWNTSTDLLPVLSIADIAIDPINTNNVYLATGDGYGYEVGFADFWGGLYSSGVMKSIDGGTTWSTTGLSYNQPDAVIIQRLLIHPLNASILIAATRQGIYRTTDGGVNWSQVNSTHCYDMEFNVADANTVYAAGAGNILRSTDAGATWSVWSTEPCNFGRMSIETTASDANVMYALCSGGTFFKSTNAGLNWTPKTNPPVTFYGYYDQVLECSDVNPETVIVGGVTAVVSSNGGTSWTFAQSGMHVDHKDFEFLPGSSSTIFSCNDGGIFKTINSGSSWTDLSNGLMIAQMYRMSSSTTDPNIIYSGWQDNGTQRWDGNNNTWNHVLGADGMECLVDYTTTSVVYATTQNGGLFKSINGGVNFSYIAPPGSGTWITPYVIHPTDNNTLFACYNTVFKTTDAGSNWTDIGPGNILGIGLNRAISISSSNPDYIYAADLQHIYRTSTGGNPWTDVTAGLPVSSAGINYIAISNTDPQKVWVAMSGYSSGNKVFKSSDGGATWTNVSGTLPNLPVNTIVYENNSPDRVYIGTDVGVYYRDNNSTDWLYYNDGLPNVMVHELEINYTSDKLISATYGRGLWQTNLVITPTPMITSVSIPSVNLCPGQGVKVSYTVSMPFNPGNIFTAQLSDANGSFNSPINIGTLAATGSGGISSVIPGGVPDGNGYRIRVISSNPATTGPNNGANIKITCPVSTATATSAITATSAVLEWKAVSCTKMFQVRHRKVGTLTWIITNVTGTKLTLTGLTPSTTYEWQVRTKCSSFPERYSDFTPLTTFTTLPFKAGELNTLFNSLEVYPNPLTSSATISFSVSENTHVLIDLFNAEGQIVDQLLNLEAEAGQRYQFDFNRNELPAGIYLLLFTSGDEVSSRNLVIQ